MVFAQRLLPNCRRKEKRFAKKWRTAYVFQDFRDPYRTPMQWNSDSNSGFCSNCTPWLPVNPNFNDGLNVEVRNKDTRFY